MARRPRDRWYRAALCARFPNLPWITDAHLVPPAAVVAMRTVCQACPVRGECEAAVRDEAVTAGFWAGADRSMPTIPRPRTARRAAPTRMQLSGGAA